MFGLTFEKLLLLGILASFLVGPERLPRLASQLAHLVKNLQSLGDSARTRARDEFGTELDDVDWKRLDPRQYDPRRIIRQALTEDRTAGRKIENLPSYGPSARKPAPAEPERSPSAD